VVVLNKKGCVVVCGEFLSVLLRADIGVYRKILVPQTKVVRLSLVMKIVVVVVVGCWSKQRRRGNSSQFVYTNKEFFILGQQAIS
jgi:hypothetical protein